MTAYRIDAGSLRRPQRSPDGRLRVDALLTRSGVFEYRNTDGSTRREYRPPEEVFAPESLATLDLAPVTNEHPPRLLGNASRGFALGAAGSIRRDADHPDHVAGSLAIHDASLVKALEAGKVEVSCGYACDLEERAGVSPTGERFDVIQRRIRYDHVAIVERGRAGTARVRMDSAPFTGAMQVPCYRGEEAMSEKNKPDDSGSLLATVDLVGAATRRADEATARADAAEKRAATAEGERDGLRARVTELEAARADSAKVEALEAQVETLTAALEAAKAAHMDAADPKRIHEAVTRRRKIERVAIPVLGLNFAEIDRMDDRSIMEAAIKKISGADVDSKATAEYVAARFDTLTERHEAGRKALDSLRRATAPDPTEVRIDTADAAKARQDERNRNAWRTGASKA